MRHVSVALATMLMLGITHPFERESETALDDERMPTRPPQPIGHLFPPEKLTKRQRRRLRGKRKAQQ